MTDTMVCTYLAHEAAAEHYAKTFQLSAGDLASESADYRRMWQMRGEKIASLEADVAALQSNVDAYDALVREMLTLMRERNLHLKNLRIERDMLAKRIQELLRETAEPEASDDVSPILAAIEVHQKQGVR